MRVSNQKRGAGIALSGRAVWASTAALAFVFVMFSARLVAQDASFTASVNQSTVEAGQQFAVTFTFSGSDINSGRNFRAPSFGDFSVLSGPNQSSNIQIINGAMSASLTYSYVLYARAPGAFTIGTATIEYKGRTLRTEPLKITVVRAQQQPQQERRQTAPEGVTDESIFVRAFADRNNVRPGEQVTVTYKLYTRLSVSGYDIPKVPAYQGFWAEDLEQPQRPTVVNEVLNGIQYKTAIIKRTALFPTTTGKLTVAPLEVRAQVQVRTRRTNDPFDIFFDDPFFGRVQTAEHRITTNPLAVTVTPLPPSAPPDFRGAVGRYTLDASVDAKEVKAGDPITLKIQLAGKGNIRLVQLPKPMLPADFEVYEPKESEEVTREGGIIGGRKSAEYLIVPRNQGTRMIEPVAFAYYDPSAKTYKSLTTPRFTINVLPGKTVAGGPAPAAKTDIQLLGRDIRYIKLSDGGLTTSRTMPWEEWWFIVLLIVPPFVAVGTLVYQRRMQVRLGNTAGIRFKTAGREAGKRLKQAKKLLGSGNTEQYNEEIARALLTYLSDKLQIHIAQLTIDGAAEELKSRSVEEETIELMRSCYHRAEFARFAPGGDTGEARRELLDEAEKVISALERDFSGWKKS